MELMIIVGICIAIANLYISKVNFDKGYNWLGMFSGSIGVVLLIQVTKLILNLFS